MTPAARLAAVIELAGEIEESIARRGPSADTLIQRYFRQRRYAGSGDRAAITGRIYGLLRRRGELTWRLMSAGSPIAIRRMALLLARLDGDLGPELFEGEHAPESMDDAEAAAIETAAGFTEPRLWARINVPEWLFERLAVRFGGDLETEMAAMDARATVDLRVNTLKSTRDSVATVLADFGIACAPTPYSPVGLRLEGRPVLDAAEPVKQGAVAIQDEGSQIAALLCAAEPREQVVDLCAGSGGKTLALAAAMANKGQIYALDVDKKRLDELKRRAQRAGVANFQIQRITRGPEKRRRQLASLTGRADLAVVDAPCSGSGTWRRHPELRWRLDPELLAEQAARQHSLVLEAMDLVRSGGRVVYIVCSLLREEGENVVDAVLGEREDAELIDYRRAAEAAGLTAIPESAAEAPESLLLTPARHATDGFFIALFRRRAE